MISALHGGWEFQCFMILTMVSSGKHCRLSMRSSKMGFPLGDENKMEELSLGFSNHSGGILDGCMLALDGFGVSSHAPY